MLTKSNKDLSFGTLIDKGLPKEEIMKIKNIKTEKEYQRVYDSLIEARARTEAIQKVPRSTKKWGEP
jgi:hypothetical protein